MTTPAMKHTIFLNKLSRNGINGSSVLRPLIADPFPCAAEGPSVGNGDRICLTNAMEATAFF